MRYIRRPAMLNERKPTVSAGSIAATVFLALIALLLQP